MCHRSRSRRGRNLIQRRCYKDLGQIRQEKVRCTQEERLLQVLEDGIRGIDGKKHRQKRT